MKWNVNEDKPFDEYNHGLNVIKINMFKTLKKNVELKNIKIMKWIGKYQALLDIKSYWQNTLQKIFCLF